MVNIILVLIFACQGSGAMSCDSASWSDSGKQITKSGLNDMSNTLLAHFHGPPLQELPFVDPWIGESEQVPESRGPVLHLKKVHFSCSEGECDHFYRTCSLSVEYMVSRSGSTERGGEDVAVTCRAGIRYRTEGGHLLQNSAGPITSNYRLGSRRVRESRVKLNFYFSEYEQVIGAALDDVHCSISQDRINISRASKSRHQLAVR